MRELHDFVCALCGADCLTTTTEAEANREFLNSGIKGSGGLCSVCDDCYTVAMSRARELGLLE